MTISEHSSSSVEWSPNESSSKRKSSLVRPTERDLIDCVDKGLLVFASDGDRAAYWRSYLVSKTEPRDPNDIVILQDPYGFQKAIEDTFGLGAWAVERAITKEIRNSFHLEPSESRGLISAIEIARNRLTQGQQLSEVTPPRTVQKRGFFEPLKSFASLAKSEYRVTMFVWALVVAYLLAKDLKPNLIQLGELVVACYFVSFGVYVFNALSDVEEDRIDHPSRPLASSSVPISDAWGIFGVSVGISMVTSFYISIPCLILVLTAFLLGVAYSHPSIRAKRRLPLKVLVSAAGAVMVSVCGGLVAGNVDVPVYFSAVFFGLFAMVTLLLGDISDIQGDTAAGVRSLPVVIGARNSIYLIACIPLVIACIGVAFFRAADLNPLFPVLLVIVNAYSSLSIISLLGKYNDYEVVRRVKSRMRLVHFAIQLTLLLGLLAL